MYSLISQPSYTFYRECLGKVRACLFSGPLFFFHGVILLQAANARFLKYFFHLQALRSFRVGSHAAAVCLDGVNLDNIYGYLAAVVEGTPLPVLSQNGGSKNAENAYELIN